jgi:2-dehydropantoate 2-reductase
MEHILYCVAQGMDAVKEGNRLTYEHTGMLVFGEKEKDAVSTKLSSIAAFFDKVNFPYQIDTDMKKRLWGKFMMNVGVNQAVSVYEGDYGTVQREGEPRTRMILAMREVIAISIKEKINLTEEDLSYWLKVLNTLNPLGKPSMRQDMEAGRFSEVDLFAGTVLELGKKYGILTPVNRMFYDTIKAMESKFSEV